jgi:hypothetical protein
MLEFARDYLPYRWKHPEKGTDSPMKFRQIRRFGRHFDKCDFQGFGVASTVVLGLAGRRDGRWYRSSHRLDEQMLAWLPFLRRFGRFVVTCVEKAAKEPIARPMCHPKHEIAATRQ